MKTNARYHANIKSALRGVFGLALMVYAALIVLWVIAALL